MTTESELIPLTPVGTMVDPVGRTITYLRISITDRCNLRCVYCMPAEGIQFQPREEILDYEEIAAIVRVAADMGLKQVRITGGEPLVRNGVVELVRMIASIPGIEDVSMTTNGIALAKYAGPLAQAGLRRVNISLDTWNPAKFNAVTRLGKFENVLAGIEAARAAGLRPIKLNVVVMLGVNDDEAVDFARTTLEHEWDVRFIELMPFLEDEDAHGCAKGVHEVEDSTPAPLQVLSHVPNEEVRARIEAVFGPLEPSATLSGQGPALYYQIPGAQGNIGFISPLTEQHFCARCNRMRLTADGKIRPCLLTDHEVDLKTTIRSGGGDEGIRQGILRALQTKPDAHHLADGNRPRWRKMIQIGG